MNRISCGTPVDARCHVGHPEIDSAASRVVRTSSAPTESPRSIAASTAKSCRWSSATAVPSPTSRTSRRWARSASVPASPSATAEAEPVAEVSPSDASCLTPSSETACFASDDDTSRHSPGSSNPLAPTEEEPRRPKGFRGSSLSGAAIGSVPELNSPSPYRSRLAGRNADDRDCNRSSVGEPRPRRSPAEACRHLRHALGSTATPTSSTPRKCEFLWAWPSSARAMGRRGALPVMMADSWRRSMSALRIDASVALFEDRTTWSLAAERESAKLHA